MTRKLRRCAPAHFRLSGGGFGDLRAMVFEETVDFGDVWRFEVGIFAGAVLRFEAIFGFASLGSEVYEVIEGFVEGAVGEPVGFGHAEGGF
jgi:hypothetical protein